jgi:hypothetical protein
VNLEKAYLLAALLLALLALGVWWVPGLPFVGGG